MSTNTPQSAPAWHSEIVAVVRHAHLPQVLLVDEYLPLCTMQPVVWPSEAERLCSELAARTGCEALLLGSLWGDIDAPRHLLRAAAVLVAQDAAWTPPPGARWTAAVHAHALPWPDAALHDALSELLAEAGGAHMPTRRPPWAVPGWFEAAAEWMAAALHDTPWRLRGPVHQFKVCGISCVLRAPTDSGAVFLKVAGGSDLFGDEPAAMMQLARRFDLVPAPLAHATEQRWMVLPDLGTILRESPDQTLRVAAMVAHGQMQLALAGRVDELLAAGLLDRRLPVLAAQIEPLLADNEARRVLGSDLHGRLAAAAPAVLSLCEQLAAYNIPASLVHGDLHAGNVAISDGRLQIFDWTDASVAHPFFDLATFAFVARGLPEGEALAERMVAEYLELWQQWESPERLRDAWRLAGVAGALHQLVSYQHILAGVEPTARWECADGLVEFAVELLRELESFHGANIPRIHYE